MLCFKKKFMKILPCFMRLRLFSCFARSAEALLSLRSVNRPRHAEQCDELMRARPEQSMRDPSD